MLDAWKSLENPLIKYKGMINDLLKGQWRDDAMAGAPKPGMLQRSSYFHHWAYNQSSSSQSLHAVTRVLRR